MSQALSSRVHARSRRDESIEAPARVVTKSRGEFEAELSNAVVGFYRSQHGRGPEHARAYLLDDLALVRQGGTLTPAEACLVGYPGGWDALKRIREKLAEVHEAELSEIVARILGHRVRSHASSSTRQGDRIDLFVLERAWDSPVA